MNSMTGFGYAENESNGFRISVEMKSLNMRYLELMVSLPPSISPLESRIRQYLQNRFTRGRLDTAIRVHDVKESLTVSVDTKAAREWKSALEKLATVLDEKQHLTLDMLIQQEGVIKMHREYDLEAYWMLLQPLIQSTADQVFQDRKREGADLAQDIANHMRAIQTSLTAIAERAPQIKNEMETHLRQRFREILGDEVAEQRILTETAAWIIKTDINEEIVRLNAHIAAFEKESATPLGIGKKLDFLAQEMGREINTIGSKSPRTDVSHHVVNMKDALESIREQLRNVE